MTTSGGDQASNATIEGANVAIGASFTGQLAVLTNSAIAADSGGSIAFGSKYSGNAFAYYAAIKTGKDDSTSGNFGGYLQFATRANGGNVTERMRITSDGYLRLAGTGIQFNGDTAAANSLDDYEEGTFTPTVEGSTTAGTGTYSTRQGTYTKIGNLVTINVWLNWTGHTGTGNVLLANFPFTSIGTASYRASGTFGWLENLTLSANNIASIAMSPSSTNASITQYPAGGGAASGVAMDISANTHYAITYQTS
jgi:hypothetical protein